MRGGEGLCSSFFLILFYGIYIGFLSRTKRFDSLLNRVGRYALRTLEFLSLIVRSLQVCEKVRKHPAHATRQIEQADIIRVFNVLPIVRNGRLCADFSTGAFGYKEEPDEFGLCASSESFGDVGHDGNGHPPALSDKAAVA